MSKWIGRIQGILAHAKCTKRIPCADVTLGKKSKWIGRIQRTMFILNDHFVLLNQTGCASKLEQWTLTWTGTSTHTGAWT